jgi:hypothetical protein
MLTLEIKLIQMCFVKLFKVSFGLEVLIMVEVAECPWVEIQVVYVL